MTTSASAVNHWPGASFPCALAVASFAIAASAATEATPLEAAASGALGWTLLALAASDLRRRILPDFLTLPLIVAGIAAAALIDLAAVPAHATGAAIGFAVVVGARATYRALRGQEGIGLGDAKLLAAAGAWVSWDGLPSVVLIAAFAALASVLPRVMSMRAVPWRAPVPFGAYLCLGTWIVWIYGPIGAAS